MPRFSNLYGIQDIGVMESGLRSEIPNKCFIHSPAEKRSKLCDQALAVSDDQTVVFRCGIIDKTVMYEAEVWHEICYMGKVSTLCFS